MVSMSKAGAASLSAVGGKGRLEQDGVRGPGVSLWEAVPAARWSISPSVCSASHHFSTQQLPYLLPGFIQYQGALPRPLRSFRGDLLPLTRTHTSRAMPRFLQCLTLRSIFYFFILFNFWSPRQNVSSINTRIWIRFIHGCVLVWYSVDAQ